MDGWNPFGPVFGRARTVSDPGITSGYAWFGRTKQLGTFGAYAIKPGLPPAGLDEVMGGLLALVLNYRVIPNSELGTLPTTRGVTAWALVPLPPFRGGLDAQGNPHPAALTEEEFDDRVELVPTDQAALSGVIVAYGDDGQLSNPTIGSILQGLGASEAVAMDGSNWVMMGHQTTLFFAPSGRYKGLNWHKSAIQKYGFDVQ